MKKSADDLIARAVVDSDFRARLMADPDGVIAAEGYDVNDETRARIKEAASASPDAVNAAITAVVRDGGAAK
jgi:hypothetical protein